MKSLVDRWKILLECRTLSGRTRTLRTLGAVRDERLVVVILAAFFAFLYFRLPRMGDIWWPDAPRHAMP